MSKLFLWVGALLFLSFAAGVYAPADVQCARRIADRIALVLARERRSAATRRADEAESRAAKLQARVRALTEELDARSGYKRLVGDSAAWKQILVQATFSDGSVEDVTRWAKFGSTDETVTGCPCTIDRSIASIIATTASPSSAGIAGAPPSRTQSTRLRTAPHHVPGSLK